MDIPVFDKPHAKQPAEDNWLALLDEVSKALKARLPSKDGTFYWSIGREQMEMPDGWLELSEEVHVELYEKERPDLKLAGRSAASAKEAMKLTLQRLDEDLKSPPTTCRLAHPSFPKDGSAARAHDQTAPAVGCGAQFRLSSLKEWHAP